MATPIRTSTSSGPDAGGTRRRSRRPVFDKDQATLFLLTVTLGLGLGAVIRIVQRADQASAAQRAALRQTAPQTASIYGGTSYGAASQPTYVLPQRTYGARGTTRMS